MSAAFSARDRYDDGGAALAPPFLKLIQRANLMMLGEQVFDGTFVAFTSRFRLMP
ncbi:MULTISPECIES: hypothetical protein [unclassified Ensifer]|uniref:hypothetical protein n=1 Tax=unclassified Ensifer TaxID=2633371 RepID=UPI00137A9AFC|nr:MULTISPECIES: hypothetical protein [unclassified Ensifer]